MEDDDRCGCAELGAENRKLRAQVVLLELTLKDTLEGSTIFKEWVTAIGSESAALEEVAAVNELNMIVANETAELAMLVDDQAEEIEQLKRSSPFDRLAADRMAAAIDHMIACRGLDARSPAGDARLDYGSPFDPETAKRMFFDCEQAPKERHGESAELELICDCENYIYAFWMNLKLSGNEQLAAEVEAVIVRIQKARSSAAVSQ